MSAVPVVELEEGVRFGVRVQPRASRDGVAGAHGGALKVRLTAPPLEGRANEALVEFLAGVLGVSRSAVRIVSGLSSRNKIVEVDGVPASAITKLAE